MYSILTVSEECPDPSVYGLDKGIKVDIHYGQKKLSFTLGDTSSAVEGCYLSLAESKAVYLADISSSVAFNHKSKYSIISIDKYPVFTADSLSEVKISSSNKTLELLKEPKGFKAHLGTWAMLRNEKSYPLNETLSDELLYLVKDISFKECVFYKPDETKLNELFKSGAQLEVTYIHSVKNEDGTSKDTPVDFSLLLSEKSETGSYYAKLKSSDMVCTVDGKSVEAILSFLNKDILDTRIFGFDESKLGSIKLTKGEESHVLKKTVVKDPNEQSTLIKYELDSTPMSSDASEKLTTLISKAKADSLIDITPSSTPEISFEFILSDQSSYAVNFYSLDNESFAVESDGLCFKAVKKSNIEDIIKLFSK
jgi:hypothetical protein